MPKPNFSGWSLSPKGARGLSFAEKMDLQRYWDDRVRYSNFRSGSVSQVPSFPARKRSVHRTSSRLKAA